MSDSTADSNSTLAGKVVSVTTGARLHFGLLSTTAPFGGVGVMIDRPQTQIVVRPAESFQCAEQVADRVVPIARRVQRLSSQAALPACAIEVGQRAEKHSGLGSGTQLAMAVAEALAQFCGLKLAPETLASKIADRGKRSAVGVYGYFGGGLIYEDAVKPCDLNPCKHRVAIPEDWCVGLFQPPQASAPVSGQLEQSHFQSLSALPHDQQAALAALITRQIIPAASDEDFAAFADAVHRYNHQSGLLFQSVQGGAYHGPDVSELVEALLQRGAAGVGQSSWGPTVFAWFPDASKATAFQRALPANVKTLAIAKPLNRPRDLISQATRSPSPRAP